ncbi:MAG: hypothetical protein COZ21_13250, partial [Bacteroidetes bacterium CG_4_10_14_3_um_filter_31_20]
GFCDTTIHAGVRFTNYVWNTGNVEDTLEYLTVSSSGNYSVTVTDIFGFTSTDSINVTFPNLAISDSTICFGDTMVHTVNQSGINSFVWSNGDTGNVFKSNIGGQFSVIMTDNFGCTFKDTFFVFIDSLKLQLSLGNDTTLCSGNYIALWQGASQTISYLWPDGSTGTIYTVDTTGAYWVIVTDSFGCTATDTITVTIQGTAPIAGFTATAVCLGNNTIFTDTSSTPDSANIINWLWNFGDGSVSTIQNPVHLYDSAGNYSVTLTVTTDSGCSASISKNVTVYPLPTASLSFTEPACANNPVTFTDNSIIPFGTISSWQWNFGDIYSNSDTSSLQNPSYTYTSIGEYYVKLTVTSSAGCADSVVSFVKIFTDSACFLPLQIAGLKLWLSSDSVALHSDTVQTWYDISGNNNNAFQTDTSKQPFWFNSSSVLNNNPVIRFDGINDFLQFTSGISNIRTAFFIVKHSTGNQGVSPLLGDISTYDWYSGYSTTLFNSDYTSPYIQQGSCFVNSQSVNPMAILKPMEYIILSVITTGNVNASNIANDRNSSFWMGDFAEIILYDTVLSNSERIQVENYLRYKYSPPVNLGPDIVANGFCDTTIHAGVRFTNYVWNTGNVEDTLEYLT